MANQGSQLGFIRSALSEPSGEGSASRTGVLVVLVFAHLWVTFLLVFTHKLPDLGPLTIWVSSIVGVLYGTNKLAATATAIGTKPAPPEGDNAPQS